MQIKKENDKIIFEFEAKGKRCNPYDDEHDYGTYPTFTGLIVRHKNGLDEIGFALTIDMDYKDKADQFTDIVVHWQGEEEKFIEICKEFGFEIVELEYCQECGETIFGCYSLNNELKPVCMLCEDKLAKK